MPVVSYNDWVDEELYMDEMARMHKLNPKLDVINCLYAEFDLLKSDATCKPDLKGDSRQEYLAELSGQIVALSLELTDDLAATCLAYLKSISNKDKCVIEWISNYRTEEGHRFFARTSKDRDYSTLAVGLDPASTAPKDKEDTMQKFAHINKMRVQFWSWYNGYKHGQYATPVVLSASDPKGKQMQEWGLYLIPKKFRRDIKQKKIHTEDRFINTVGNVTLFVELAKLSVSLWLEMRNRQYQIVFGRPYG